MVDICLRARVPVVDVRAPLVECASFLDVASRPVAPVPASGERASRRCSWRRNRRRRPRASSPATAPQSHTLKGRLVNIGIVGDSDTVSHSWHVIAECVFPPWIQVTTRQTVLYKQYLFVVVAILFRPVSVSNIHETF